MATLGDERDPYESCGDGEKSRKRHFRPDIIEQVQNILPEAGRSNPVGVSEVERMLKQMTCTRSEIQHLTALLHSSICDNDVESEQQTTIENLPADILYKVFIRLLAKQLAQMRCVSKSWNVVLSQSYFVKSHLHHSITNSDQILLVFHNNQPKKNPRFTAFPSQSPHLKLTNFIKVPPLPGHTYRTINIIGSVHGLICSCYGDDVIHIWNPSLSLVSTLPPYSFRYSGCYEIHFRFGFDPNTNDYKVIKITGLTQPVETSVEEEEEDDLSRFLHVIKKWLHVEIYSMRTGSWKLITHRFPSHITRIFNKDDVCVDGHDGRVHWVGHTNEKIDSEMIVAFDFGSETFLEMNLPDDILDYDRWNTLGVLGGKLCVMSRDGEGEIDVWVMDEYGVSESWVKRHVFCISHYLGDAVTGITSHNEFLIEDGYDRLVLYDFIADNTRMLDEDILAKHSVDRIVEYVDSLVWVTPPRNISY